MLRIGGFGWVKGSTCPSASNVDANGVFQRDVINVCFCEQPRDQFGEPPYSGGMTLTVNGDSVTYSLSNGTRTGNCVRYDVSPDMPAGAVVSIAYDGSWQQPSEAFDISVSIGAFVVPDHVATPATISTVLASFTDGEIIELSDGTYTGVAISYSQNNARIYGRNPGSVIFDGDSRIFFDGTGSQADGIHFSGTNGVYAVRFYGATNGTLRDCKFTNCGVDAFSFRPIIMFENGATGCVVEYVEMSGNDAIGIGVDVDAGETLPTSNTARYVYIKDILTDTNKEPVQIGQGDRATETTTFTLEESIFENCDGDAEAVSIKTSGNTIKNNLVLNSDGYIVLREGNNNTVEGNVVSGCPVGIRVHGENHTIQDNLLVNNTVGISIPAGASTYTVGGGLHDAAENCTLTDNAIVSNTTSYEFDEWYDGVTYDTYPSSITINTGVTSNTGAQTLISSVQDVFTWSSNQYADLDWSLTTTPDSKFTLITDQGSYYSALNLKYSGLTAAEYAEAVTTYAAARKAQMKAGVTW